MEGMEVLAEELGDVDHDGDTMSPLAGSDNIAHDEVSELEKMEQEAHALAAADIDHDDEDDSGDIAGVNAHRGSDVGDASSSVQEGGILIHGQSSQAIVTSEQVISLLMHTSDANSVSVAAGVKLSMADILPEMAVVNSDGTQSVHTFRAVTLTDGTTAFIQQPQDSKLVEGQTLTLEDGITAVVQGSATSKAEPLDDKLLEGQTIQLDDGTTAFLQHTSKAALSEGLQAIQLEDGTTAYIAHPNAESLFGDATSLDAATLDSLTSQINSAGTKQQMTVEKVMSIGEKAYKCGYEDCGRLYTTLHHLKVHERSHTGDRPFRCDYPECGKAFATGYGLKSHTRVHTGEKPYPCPEEGCDKAFKTAGDLQKHVRTHTGERPFKCPFEGCNRSFTTSNIRKVHIRTHTGERPYICAADNCGRAFASATNYKNHVRIHTGEKPYVCTVQGCGKRFTEYSSLYKHHVVHTHSKPYICNYCGKTYRQTSTLAMHKRTAHGEDSFAEADAHLLQNAEGEEENGEQPNKRSRLRLSLSDSDSRPGGEEGEGTLIINTADPQQVALLKDRVHVVADLVSDGTGAGIVALPGQVTLQALQAQGLTGITVSEQGQQVLVVTDPVHLEALQQLAQQHLESAVTAASTDGAVSQTSTMTTVSCPVTLDSAITFPVE